MKLNVQKRIAADILGCSQHSIRFDQSRLDDIKEAITKADVRGLISDGVIYTVPKRSPSRSRIRKKDSQKRKGRLRGKGTRKGKSSARLPRKDAWMQKIRTQRNFLKSLKRRNILDPTNYRKLYRKAKGGFFRSKRHIKLYIQEFNLAKKK